jgi:hypothetical protein
MIVNCIHSALLRARLKQTNIAFTNVTPRLFVKLASVLLSRDFLFDTFLALISRSCTQEQSYNLGHNWLRLAVFLSSQNSHTLYDKCHIQTCCVSKPPLPNLNVEVVSC